MKTISRYIMTLLLLITAATGAWAQTTVTWTEADLTGSGSDLNTYTKDGVTIKCSDRISSGKSFNGPVTISTTLGNFTKIEITGQGSAPIQSDIFTNDGNVSTWTGNASSLNFPNAIAYATQFVFTIAPSGPEVTITGTSTEGQQASFQMPQYDVTATYTLKRDLSVETQVTVGDGTDGVRYRVQKQGNTFQPYGMTTAQVMALFHVHDQIEQEDLTAVQDYTVQIYAVDIEGQPTGEAITFQNFTYAPGQYIVKAQGQGNYVGQTTESNIFTLYQGYEIDVPLTEYATAYYENENLRLEGDDADYAKLYIIKDVDAAAGTASVEAVEVVPAGVPFIVYNESGSTDPNFLLIPVDAAAAVEYADENFFGTETEKTFTDEDMADADHYIFNGKEFVWVKEAGTLAAHKCWLEIAKDTGADAPRRIVFVVDGEATGIAGVAVKVADAEGWYDLSGRKLNAVPTQKGIYIVNGKKVMVK